MTIKIIGITLTNMKVEELMFGDLVQVAKDVCIKKGTIVKVRSIDGDNSFPEKGLKGCATCVALDDRTLSGGVWVEYLNPIPLTPEIFEKNRFHKQVWNDLVTEYTFATDLEQSPQTVIQFTSYSREIEGVKSLLKMWTKSKYGHGQNDVHLCGIYYVHELQHALRIIGLNEIADNFVL